MTDKEWNKLMYKRGRKCLICSHPNGLFCVANDGSKCIALYNTRFSKPCPFFRDIATMSSEEYGQYREFVKSLEGIDNG